MQKNDHQPEGILGNTQIPPYATMFLCPCQSRHTTISSYSHFSLTRPPCLVHRHASSVKAAREVFDHRASSTAIEALRNILVVHLAWQTQIHRGSKCLGR
ncbi:hypothetical protein RND81_13G101800 [Saponaria officinalis]|uniref:Uncharacterized protein n=1 Tax=Saponaria officinalis TaxID=3572 RepID=A0AAW1GVW1_SAPOF